MKDSNLSQGACECADENTTTYLRDCARRSVDVVAGVRIVRSHASINVVIGVRDMEFHACIDVRVVLCRAFIGDSTFVNFPLRVRILILLSCCSNSSLLLPVVIFVHTFCTEEIRHLRCGI